MANDRRHQVESRVAMNYVGWQYLLQGGPWQKVLCVDPTMGSLAVSLARMCQELHVIDSDSERLKAISKNLAREGINDSVFLHLYKPKNPVSVSADSFDVCVLCDLDRALGSDNLEKPSELLAGLEAVFREIGRILRPDGLVYVSVGNRYSYNRWTAWSRIKGRAGSGGNQIWSCPIKEVRDTLLRAGIARQAVYPLLFEGNQLSEVVVGAPYTSVKNGLLIKERLKELLLSFGLERIFAHGFGVVASKSRSQSNFLNVLLNDLVEKGMIPYKHRQMYDVKRYCVLTGKVVVSIGQRNRRHGCIVVVLPQDSLALSRRRNEGEVLRDLAQSDLTVSALVPKFYCEGELHGQPYFALSEIEGISIDVNIPQLKEVTSRAFQVLVTFHHSTARKVFLGEAEFRKLFGKIFEDAGVKVGPNFRDRIGQIEAFVRARAMGKRVNTVWLHGDFNIENVIVDPKSFEVKGIIDWELSQKEGLPLIDLLYFLTYNRKLLEKKEMGEIFRDVVLPMRWSSSESYLLDCYLKDVQLSGEMLRVTPIMFGIHHIAYRVKADLSGRELSWTLSLMLEAMERQLK